MSAREVIDRVMQDGNRTAEQVSKPPYRYKVKAVVIEEFVYDEDLDGLRATGKTFTNLERGPVFGG